MREKYNKNLSLKFPLTAEDLPKNVDPRVVWIYETAEEVLKRRSKSGLDVQNCVGSGKT